MTNLNPASAPHSSCDISSSGQQLEHSRIAEWWLIGTLGVMLMLSSVDRQILALLLDSIKRDLVLSDTQVSLVFGLSFAVVHACVAIPGGWLADRARRSRIVAAGATIWSLMTAVCGLASSYTQLFVARMGVGLAEGIVEPSIHSILRDAIAPERRGRAFSVVGMAPLIGAGLAIILGGVLLSFLSTRSPIFLPVVGVVSDWQVVLVLVGLCGLPLVCLMLTIAEPARRYQASVISDQISWAATFRFLRSNALLYTCLFGFALTHAIIGAAFGAWGAVMFLRVWDLSPIQVGLGLGLAMLVAAPIGAFVGGMTIDVMRKSGGPGAGLPLIGIVSTLILGTVASASPLANSLPAAIAFLVVHMMLAAVPVAVCGTAIARATPSHLMGKVVSLRIWLQGLIAIALGPTLVALAGDNIFGGEAGGPRAIAHGLSLVCAISAVCALLACIGFWQVSRTDKHGALAAQA